MKYTMTYEMFRMELLKDHWTLPEIFELWQYYTELEESLGEETEFDRVIIRSEWGAYDSIKELRDDYEQCVEPTDEEFMEWMNKNYYIRRTSQNEKGEWGYLILLR